MTEDNTKTIKVDFKFSYIQWVTSMANGDTFYDEDAQQHYELVGKRYYKTGEDEFWVDLLLKAI